MDVEQAKKEQLMKFGIYFATWLGLNLLYGVAFGMSALLVFWSGTSAGIALTLAWKQTDLDWIAVHRHPSCAHVCIGRLMIFLSLGWWEPRWYYRRWPDRAGLHVVPRVSFAVVRGPITYRRIRPQKETNNGE